MRNTSDNARTLDTIVLPGNLTDQVRALLDEWHQSAMLRKYGIQPRNRVLLYGPPGNGKTTLAGVVAHELGRTLQVLRYADVASEYIGQTEQGLVKVFKKLEEGTVLFLDECDSLCTRRSMRDDAGARANNSTVNTLLSELDRLSPDSVVFFATNFDQILDPAMRRRINLTLELPAPSRDDLRRLLASLIRRHPLWPLSGFDFDGCQATSFAALEQAVVDHARTQLLAGVDPLGIANKPRSQWLREQLAARDLAEPAVSSP